MSSAKLIPWAFATLLFAACGDATGPEPSSVGQDGQEIRETRHPSSLALYPTVLSMPVDDSYTVTVTIFDQHGEPFETIPQGVEIDWATNHESVVSVQDGVLTSGDLGAATVTASADGLGSANVRAEVLPARYGELTFTHGDRTFTIEGVFGFDPDDTGSVWANRRSWAFTAYWIKEDQQYIYGRSRGEDGDLYGEVYLYLHGEVTDPRTHDHAGWIGYLGLNHELGAGYQEWYDLYDLKMTFTTVTEDRVKGTFSFDLVDWSSGDAEVVAEVTNGSCDLPVGADL